MQALTKKIFSLSLLLLSALSLTAQAEKPSPYKVNGPATKADPTIWETPFLWIGILVFSLVVLLMFLRRNKKNATYNKLHKY